MYLCKYNMYIYIYQTLKHLNHSKVECHQHGYNLLLCLFGVTTYIDLGKLTIIPVRYKISRCSL